MGTALVIREDQAGWEAAHNVLFKKARLRAKGQKSAIRLFQLSALMLPVMIGFIWFEVSNIIAVPVSMIGFCLMVYLCLDFRFLVDPEIGNLKFDCPSCRKTINLASPWKCGNCPERHTKARDNSLPLGCKNDECGGSNGIPRHRAQAAVQCPECKDHIVLNPLLYKQLGSDRADLKYPGVARFLHDEEQPNIGGQQTDDLPNVGQLSAAEYIDERMSRIH